MEWRGGKEVGMPTAPWEGERERCLYVQRVKCEGIKKKDWNTLEYIYWLNGINQNSEKLNIQMRWEIPYGAVPKQEH